MHGIWDSLVVWKCHTLLNPSPDRSPGMSVRLFLLVHFGFRFGFSWPVRSFLFVHAAWVVCHCFAVAFSGICLRFCGRVGLPFGLSGLFVRGRPLHLVCTLVWAGMVMLKGYRPSLAVCWRQARHRTHIRWGPCVQDLRATWNEVADHAPSG